MGVEGVGSLVGERELFVLPLPPERVRSLRVCVCVCVCVCVRMCCVLVYQAKGRWVRDGLSSID